MFQLNFVFDIIIQSRRITVSESFYCIRYEVTEKVHKSFVKSLGVDIFAMEGFFPIKRFDSTFMALILVFL